MVAIIGERAQKFQVRRQFKFDGSIINKRASEGLRELKITSKCLRGLQWVSENHRLPEGLRLRLGWAGQGWTGLKINAGIGRDLNPRFLQAYGTKDLSATV